MKIKDTHSLGAPTSAERHNDYTEIKDTHNFRKLRTPIISGAPTSAERHNDYTRLRHNKRKL